MRIDDLGNKRLELELVLPPDSDSGKESGARLGQVLVEKANLLSTELVGRRRIVGIEVGMEDEHGEADWGASEAAKRRI